MARVALRAGSDAPQLFYDGAWVHLQPRDDDFELDITKYPYDESCRKLQFKRLEKYGQPPDETEDGEPVDASLPWPQRFWWRDRDRIVLLHEYLEAWPPMGHTSWEECIKGRVALLWGTVREGVKDEWEDLHDLEMCGYRYLAALASCPRSLRPGMSQSLLESV